MITLYIGKSGVGKDTFLKKQVDLGVTPIISYTTRPKRENEVDGVDYNFVSDNQFNELVMKGALSEWRAYKTITEENKPAIWYYGSPWLDENKDYVGVVTPSGVESYLQNYGADALRVIYIEVNDDIRKARAEERGSFVEAEWNRRLKADNEDFSREVLKDLALKLGKPIIVMYNNGDMDKVTFSEIEP